MALTTVAELRTALGVGTLYTDAVLQQVCDAADDVLLPFLWNNYTFNVGHSNTTTEGTLYFEQSIEDVFYVGQTVTISGNGELRPAHGPDQIGLGSPPRLRDVAQAIGLEFGDALHGD